ncbi:hypothetical protein MTR67_007488 [Solanum verrucosum]|uniref:Uncharacterized protein n=1 Tax=Solanum verrucosum TaxID=315347 RepID=A0AAF0Q0B2_SOLVR|nr:hypothetical protein MTR67_007488 [Solanum verrucosum]
MLHKGSKSSFVADVKAKQCLDTTVEELKEAVLRKSGEAFSQGGDGVLRYQDHLCVPNIDDLREHILKEAHSSRGTQFTSQFWKSFQKGLGTKVKLNTSFHPQIDGYQSSISIAPFEAIYRRRCRSPIGWFEVGEVALIGPELVHEAIEKAERGQNRPKSTKVLCRC